MIDITKIANVILYMLHKKVSHLNDKKLSILLFLIDYNHKKHCGETIFGEEYIKASRHPEPVVLGELFSIIANNEDLDDDDPNLYLIQELLDYLDIEIVEKKSFVELQFIKMEEEFDEELFSEDELKTIHKVVLEHLESTPRNIANACFKLDIVREVVNGEKIL